MRDALAESSGELRRLSIFPARQARIGHRGHVSAAARSLEAGSGYLGRVANKKKSRRVTLADSFFSYAGNMPGNCPETVPGFEGTRRLRHMPPVPTARLAGYALPHSRVSAAHIKMYFADCFFQHCVAP